MLRLELDTALSGVAAARRQAGDEVRRCLGDRPGLDDIVDDVALIVSELVTNAIVHGEPPVVLELTADDRGAGCQVVVTCTDTGPWDGSPPDPLRGRGLVLVRALAELAVVADVTGTEVRATLVR